MKRKTKIARRMWNIHMIDHEIEYGFCALNVYFKYGQGWLNGLRKMKGENNHGTEH